MMEIRIKVDDAGRMEIIHPEGEREIRDAIYFLDLAKSMLMARSLNPPKLKSPRPILVPDAH